MRFIEVKALTPGADHNNAYDDYIDNVMVIYVRYSKKG